MTGEARTYHLGLNLVYCILKALFLFYSVETMENNRSTVCKKSTNQVLLSSEIETLIG